MEGAGDRIAVAGDILNFDDFFTDDDQLQFDQKAFQKRLNKAAHSVELLQSYRQLLAASGPDKLGDQQLKQFDAANLEQHLKSWLEGQGAQIGDIIHALRVAVTGKAVGFGMLKTLEVLGLERCLIRIDRALEQVDPV